LEVRWLPRPGIQPMPPPSATATIPVRLSMAARQSTSELRRNAAQPFWVAGDTEAWKSSSGAMGSDTARRALWKASEDSRSPPSLAACACSAPVPDTAATQTANRQLNSRLRNRLDSFMADSSPIVGLVKGARRATRGLRWLFCALRSTYAIQDLKLL